MLHCFNSSITKLTGKEIRGGFMNKFPNQGADRQRIPYNPPKEVFDAIKEFKAPEDHPFVRMKDVQRGGTTLNNYGIGTLD